MSAIPLDLQRRFEKRWASRFTGAPNDFVTSGPNNFGSKAAPLTVAVPRALKTRRVEAAGSAWSGGPELRGRDRRAMPLTDGVFVYKAKK